MNKIHLRIGSAADNQVVIHSSDVAPYHLELFCDTDGHVFITDLGSDQGTFINNRRLDGFQLLKKNDHVRFGQNQEFDWTDYVPEVKTQERPTFIDEEVQEMPTKKQAPKETTNSVSNKQLLVIYGSIVLLILLLSLYL
ncbi:MAG: FHA domain-containing protein [Flavobacteriales bacterium]